MSSIVERWTPTLWASRIHYLMPLSGTTLCGRTPSEYAHPVPPDLDGTPWCRTCLRFKDEHVAAVRARDLPARQTHERQEGVS